MASHSLDDSLWSILELIMLDKDRNALGLVELWQGARWMPFLPSVHLYPGGDRAKEAE